MTRFASDTCLTRRTMLYLLSQESRELIWMPAGCSLYPWLNPIEIIGEAASRVSPACQAKYAGIPWPEIIGMRNRLIHAYFDINLDIVWRTITEELPPLVAELEKALSSGEAE